MQVKTIEELRNAYRTAPPNWRKHIAHQELKNAVTERLIEELRRKATPKWLSTVIFWRPR